MVNEVISCDARAVIRIAEHVANDSDIHPVFHPFSRTLLFVPKVHYTTYFENQNIWVTGAFEVVTHLVTNLSQIVSI